MALVDYANRDMARDFVIVKGLPGFPAGMKVRPHPAQRDAWLRMGVIEESKPAKPAKARARRADRNEG